MKRLTIFLFALAPGVFGQWVVFDPTNHLVNSAIQANQQANHLEVLKQWADELDRLNRQLRELEEAVVLQRRIRDVLGDPVHAGTRVGLQYFGQVELSRTYGETLRAVQRLANSSLSLRRTVEGIFGALDDRTSLRREFPRQESLYRRYAAVEQQAENLIRVHEETDARAAQLQADLGGTLAQLQSASTAAETDKLNVKVAALNGQLALLAARRRDEADKLRAQQILNENQAAKERQDLLEKQIAEERDTLAGVSTWQRSIRLTPTNYTSR